MLMQYVTANGPTLLLHNIPKKLMLESSAELLNLIKEYSIDKEVTPELLNEINHIVDDWITIKTQEV